MAKESPKPRLSSRLLSRAINRRVLQTGYQDRLQPLVWPSSPRPAPPVVGSIETTAPSLPPPVQERALEFPEGILDQARNALFQFRASQEATTLPAAKQPVKPPPVARKQVAPAMPPRQSQQQAPPVPEAGPGEVGREPAEAKITVPQPRPAIIEEEIALPSPKMTPAHKVEEEVKSKPAQTVQPEPEAPPISSPTSEPAVELTTEAELTSQKVEPIPAIAIDSPPEKVEPLQEVPPSPPAGAETAQLSSVEAEKPVMPIPLPGPAAEDRRPILPEKKAQTAGEEMPRVQLKLLPQEASKPIPTTVPDQTGLAPDYPPPDEPAVSLSDPTLTPPAFSPVPELPQPHALTPPISEVGSPYRPEIPVTLEEGPAELPSPPEKSEVTLGKTPIEPGPNPPPAKQLQRAQAETASPPLGQPKVERVSRPSLPVTPMEPPVIEPPKQIAQPIEPEIQQHLAMGLATPVVPVPLVEGTQAPIEPLETGTWWVEAKPELPPAQSMSDSPPPAETGSPELVQRVTKETEPIPTRIEETGKPGASRPETASIIVPETQFLKPPSSSPLTTIQRSPLVQPRAEAPPSTSAAEVTAPPSSPKNSVTAAPLDLEQVAQQVYQILCRRLRVEQERSRGSILS